MLQTYFDRMTELITAHRLKEHVINDTAQVFVIARARTVATLRRLKDVERRNSLLQFLSYTELPLLRKATLNDIDLERAYLVGVNLEGAQLNGVNLKEANLFGANLDSAFLSGANLKEANLVGVNLQGAFLDGASLERADLLGVILKEIRYSDATIWPEGFTPPPSALNLDRRSSSDPATGSDATSTAMSAPGLAQPAE